MTDPTRPTGGDDTASRYEREPGPRVPRWVMLAAVIAAILVVLVVIMIMVGGGGHGGGPSRHGF
jgi:hypothetical protein